MRVAGLRAFRLAAIVAVCWFVHLAAAEGRARTAVPLTVREIQAFLPAAVGLADEVGPLGRAVTDAGGDLVGWAASTSPVADDVVGYAGPTEVLIVTDPDGIVVRVRVRRSADTAEHVADVRDDPSFLATFTGRPWRDLAGTDLERLGVDGVAGATRTSAAIAESIGLRLAAAAADAPTPRRFAATIHDLWLFALTAAGVWLAFDRRARRMRRWFQVATVGYLGWFTAEFLAWSLFVPWIEGGLPWRATPGLVALFGASLLVPWATGRSVYCAHVCPHGALQEWIGRLAPRRLRRPLPDALRFAFAGVPVALIAIVVTTRLVGAPLGLAGVEAFDAWTLGAAATGALLIAGIGLAASAVVPMAYCRYGCPTGAVFALVTTGRGDRLGWRDLLLAGLVAFAAGGYVWRDGWRLMIAQGWPA